MFCPKCGKDTEDGSRFCSACGADLCENVQEQEADSQEASGRLPLIIAIAVIAIVIVVLTVAIVMLVVNKKSGADMEDDGQEAMALENVETSATEVQSSVIAVEEEPAADMTAVSEQPDDTMQLLVTVPTETMSLRTSPGLGDDVVAELPANTYLKWDGESVVDENEKMFYKVVVRDTQQAGYVSADFCVKVDYVYDEGALSVVKTDDALYTYDRMVADMETLCNSYSDILSYNVMGTSLDGRNIYEIVLGSPSATNHVMVQASIHGREYMNTQLVMKLIEYYASFYDTGTFNGISYSDLFAKTAFHIVPMANPDGVTISQLGTDALNDQYYADLIYECYERDKQFLAYREDSLGDMNWTDLYKEEGYNREEQGDIREITFEEYTKLWKANAAGVDLNNNFDAGWEAIDLKKQPSYGNYKGSSEVSEPETQVLAQLALAREYQYYVSYHSKGQLIYFDVSGNKPDTSMRSENFATLLENFIKYKKVNTNKGYNVNLGGFSDWIQLDLNKASVTIESGKHPCPLEASEFPAIWLRHRESWAMIANSLY